MSASSRPQRKTSKASQRPEVWLPLSHQQQLPRPLRGTLLPPKFDDQLIPALSWEDTYRYLGVEVGRSSSGSADKLKKEIIEAVDKILESRLTDWQKLDAINTFALSKTTYYLSTSLLNCEDYLSSAQSSGGIWPPVCGGQHRIRSDPSRLEDAHLQGQARLSTKERGFPWRC